MKRKRRKKRRKEKKRSEEKKVAQIRTQALRCIRQATALPLGHVKHTRKSVEFLLLKSSSLIKHEFKDIFQKNDCSLDSENPT